MAEEQDEPKVMGNDLESVKKARAGIQAAIDLLNQLPDDTQENAYQVPDSVSKLDEVISLLDELIPDDEQG
jgi:hypothetical protein